MHTHAYGHLRHKTTAKVHIFAAIPPHPPRFFHKSAVQEDDFGGGVVHAGHGVAGGGVDVGGVAHDVAAPSDSEVVPFDFPLGEVDCGGKMPGIIDEHHVETEEVADETWANFIL